MSLSLATVLAGWSRPQGIGRARGHPYQGEDLAYGSPGRSLSMKRFVNPFIADGSSPSVIESGLIMVLVGLACITAWMHVSASLEIPSASADMTASVETTGSVRSQELYRASRTRRLRRSEKRLYGAGCPAQVRIGSIAPIEDRYALSRSCAAFPARRSLSLPPGQ